MKNRNLPSLQERRAILLLFLLMLLVVGVRIQLKRANLTSGLGAFSLEIAFPDSSAVVVVKKDSAESPATILVNAVTAQELIATGLDIRIAERWVKYRKSVGGFESEEDLARIYGLEDHWINHHRGALVFQPVEGKRTPVSKYTGRKDASQEEYGNKEITQKARKYIPTKKELVEPALAINVNQANMYELQRLTGIGEYYAKRIVNFRDKLGGFSTLEQVSETYGLTDSVFQKILPMLRISVDVRKLKINTISENELKSHPYIKWKEASILINYRDQHGDYLDIKDFYKIRAFDSAFVARIRPYIDFTATTELTQITLPNE